MTKYTLLLALVLTIFSLDLSCALNVSYDSNEVVSTGYTYKSFFLNSEFDRDVFVTPQCQTGPAVSYSSCATCNFVSGPKSFSDVPLQTTRATRTVYTGFITNFATCEGALVISGSLAYGEPTITITAGAWSKTILAASDVFPQFSFVSCCRDLRTSAGASWDGAVTLAFSYFAPVSAQFEIPTTPSALPLEKYAQIVPVTVTCGSEVLTCQAGCATNMVGVSDPAYTFWTQSTTKRVHQPFELPLVLETIPRTISTMLWQTRFRGNDKVGAINFGYGAKLVGSDGRIDSSCSIRYDWLVDGAESEITESSSFNWVPTACQFAVFDTYKESFDFILDTLGDKNPALPLVDPEVSTALVEMANSVAHSAAWVACRDLGHSFLAPKTKTLTENGFICLYAEGSVEWASDPCCNEAQLPYKCCLSSTYSWEETEWVAPEDPSAAVEGTCVFPDCLNNPLESLALITNQETIAECAEDRLAVERDDSFQNDPWDYCHAVTYGVPDCFVISQNAFCDVLGSLGRYRYCVVPCDPAVGCALGRCTPTPVGNVCLGISSDPPTVFNAFSKCLFDRVDPYLTSQIVEQVVASPEYNPAANFTVNFEDYLTTDACLSPKGQNWPNPSGIPYTQSECLSFQGWCPRFFCNLDFDTGCREKCFNPIPLGGGICKSHYNEFLNLVINRPDLCQVQLEETGRATYLDDQPLCERFGGTFVGPDPVTWRAYDACLKTGTGTFGSLSQSQCYTSECIPNLEGTKVCASYCHDRTKGQAACTGGTTGGRTFVWRTWNDVNTMAPMGACLIRSATGAAINLDACDAEPTGTWFQGLLFLPAQLNNRASCLAGSCLQVNSVGFLPNIPKGPACPLQICSTCIFGTEPHCFNPALCATTNGCDSSAGCVFEEGTSNKVSIPFPFSWTPIGELDPLFSQKACVPQSPFVGQYVEKWENPLLSESTCTGRMGICRDGTVVNATTDGAVTIPKGFNRRDRVECEKCGGTYENFWKWKPGKMRFFRIYVDTLVWADTPEAAIVKPQWGPKLSKDIWLDTLTTARAQRLATIYTSELLCLYGVEKELLHLISCSCGGGSDECYDELTTLSGNIYGFFTACKGIPTSRTINGIELSADNSFDNRDNKTQCEGVEVGVVPYEQFLYRTQRVLTSLAIFSETARSKVNATFLYNTEGTVNGQIISGGVFFNYGSDNELSGMEACIPILPEYFNAWELRYPLTYLDLAVSSAPFTQFTPLGFNISLDAEKYCFELVGGEDVTYFLVGLVDEYETVLIEHTWPYEELGLTIFIAITYFILFIWITYSFVMRLIFEWPPTTWYVLIGSGMIVFQFRVIYFVGAPFGTWEFEPLAILFSDLPLLLFHGAVAMTGIMWNEIVVSSTTQDKRDTFSVLAYFFIGTLFLEYIGLSIAYGALYDESKTEFNCGTTQEEKDAVTSAEAVGLAYRALFAFYSVMIALVFLVQALRILKLLKDASNVDTGGDEKRSETMKRLAMRFLITSILALAGLLIQAAVMIYAIVETLENTTKLALIITIELLPTYALAYLFRFGSPVAAAKKWGSSRATADSGRSGRSGSASNKS